MKNPLLSSDGYKTGHHLMYAPRTNVVYSNFTCRNIKYMPVGAKKIVVVGPQYTFQYINEYWNENFFSKSKHSVCQHAKRVLSSYLGTDYDVSHFEALHDLGYLPIEVRALQEGLIIDAGIPLFTIKNTHPDFFWVTNFLETLISTLIWKPVHSASLAYAYKKVLTKYARETDEKNVWFVDFQAHDFSFRGMQAPDAAISSGLGFASCFKGSDTIPVLEAAKHYYGTESSVFSVNATEHSVMCSGSKEGEIETFRRLMEKFPTGILSVVSDTWDLWKVVTEYLPQLKEEIMSRDGKLVIRPDSGDPVDIVCGLNSINGFNESLKDGFYQKRSSWFVEKDKPEVKGLIELLWDTFGGTINEQGYKVLDPHIGAIYGDSITLERAEQICERLKSKGFASTNIVFGVGSYSLGYATRDNQGGAVKSTAIEINGELVEIFKDPITDDGTKKSLKGLVGVFYNDNNELEAHDQLSQYKADNSELKLIFKDGVFVKRTTLIEIRERINATI